MGNINDDWTNGPPAGAEQYAPLPEGWYNATIEKSEIKETRSGTGSYISMMWRITGPEQANRTVFAMITVTNQSEKAAEIGRTTRYRLCQAIGLSQLGDAEDLIGHSCAIKVRIRKSEEWGDKPEIKAYRPIQGASISSADKLPF